MFSVFFFLKSCRLWDKVEKYGRAGEATDDHTALFISLWNILKIRNKQTTQ
jgi:hypothetical protein